MEPDENGEPLVPYGSLGEILAELGLPALAFSDLDSNGQIEFEPFINTLSPLLEDQQLGDEIGLQQSLFYMLSRGGAEITPETLREASGPLGLSIPQEDLEGMCALFGQSGARKEDFARLWAGLNPRARS